MSGARRAVLVLVAVFLAGIVAGLALEEIVDDWAWVERLEGENDPEDLEDAEERVLDGLGLSAEQQRRVEAIQDRREELVRQYWTDRLPDIAAIIETTRAEIRAVLDAEQRARYDRAVAEFPSLEELPIDD